MNVVFTGIIHQPSWPGGEPRVSKMLSSILSQKDIHVSTFFLPRDRPFWKIYPWSIPSVVIDSTAVKTYRHFFEKVKPSIVMTWYDYDLSAFWGSVLSGIPTISQAQTLWPVCPKEDLFNSITESPCNGPSWICGKCVIKQGRLRGEFSATSPSVIMPNIIYAMMQLQKIHNLRSRIGSASAIVSDSLFLKKTMRSLSYDVSKVHVIYNGVELTNQSFSNSTIKTVLFLSNNISIQKGYHHFVELSKKLKADFPNVRFLWVGQDKLRGGTFETIGYVWSQQVLQDLFRSCYLLLLPSLWPEPMSYSVLQAMAWEKPVVAYDVGANREAIIHNETGLLTEWGNIKCLTSNVRKLLLDEKLALQMGKNAKKRVKEKFSVEKMAFDYVNLLEEITELR